MIRKQKRMGWLAALAKYKTLNDNPYNNFTNERHCISRWQWYTLVPYHQIGGFVGGYLSRWQWYTLVPYHQRHQQAAHAYL